MSGMAKKNDPTQDEDFEQCETYALKPPKPATVNNPKPRRVKSGSVMQPTQQRTVEMTEGDSVMAPPLPSQYQKPTEVMATPMQSPKQRAPLTIAEKAYAEAMLPPPLRRMPIIFDYEPGQLLGITFSSGLGVLDVDQRPGISPVWDKIKPADILRQIGNVKVANKEQLHRCMRKQQGTVTFLVERFLTIIRLTPARKEFHELDKSCKDELLTVYLLHRKNVRLGFAVRCLDDVVVVVRVDGGIAYATLEPGDMILDINGTKVDTIEQAKSILQMALKKNAIASLAIRRPMSVESLVKVATIIKDDSSEPDMHIDAVLIGRMEACKRHLSLVKRPAEKCLVKRSRKKARQSFKPDLEKVVKIHSEVDGRDWDRLHGIPSRSDINEVMEKPENNEPKPNRSFIKFLIDKFKPS